MYLLRLCETQEISPQIMEHWLCTVQKKNCQMELILCEEAGQINLITSQDLSPHFHGSFSKNHTYKIPKGKYHVSQNKGSLLPIKRPSQFEDRVNKNRIFPMDTLVKEMSKHPNSFIHFTFNPISERKRQKALSRAKKGWFQPERKFDQWESKKWFQPSFRKLLGPLLRKASSSFQVQKNTQDEQTESLHEREDPRRAILDKLSRPLFKVQIQMSHPFNSFIHGFTLPYLGELKIQKNVSKLILSAEELASIMSPPNPQNSSRILNTEPCTYLEPPPGNPLEFQNSDRKKHLYILGKTGMGKSSTILEIFKEDLKKNQSMILMDPHGDLIEDALSKIPKDRHKDIVLIEPWKEEFPLALNPLECKPDENPLLKTSALIEMFQVLAKGSWGPRLEYILRNSILTLTLASNTTLLDLPRLLTNEKYAQSILSQITDPELLRFWNEEFFCLDSRQRTEAISPILNKVGPLITSPILRNIFGQPRSKFNINKLLEESKIILISLSKGRMGEDISRILGMIFISLIYAALLKRSDTSKEQRSFLSLTIDEFQNFATPTLMSMLSECRKYGLALTLANQYISQLPLEIQDALLGNIGSFLAFRTSMQDAEKLAPILQVLPEDLTQLPPFQAYAKFLSNNTPLPCFRFNTPNTKEISKIDPNTIRQHSQNSFGRQRHLVEKKLKNRYNIGKKNYAK